MNVERFVLLNTVFHHQFTLRFNLKVVFKVAEKSLKSLQFDLLKPHMLQ